VLLINGAVALALVWYADVRTLPGDPPLAVVPAAHV
jgi:hypothetical protein